MHFGTDDAFNTDELFVDDFQTTFPYAGMEFFPPQVADFVVAPCDHVSLLVTVGGGRIASTGGYYALDRER